MNNEMIYYHIYSGATGGPDIAREYRKEAESTWFCTGCGHPKPAFQAIDIRVQENPIEGPALNSEWGVPIARKDFLAMLGENNIQKYLYIGKVFGPNNEIVNDWVTFRGKEKLIVRGSKNAQHRSCDQCGRNVYFAMGKSYLYPSPPKGIALFESDLCGLIMPETLFPAIDPARLKGLLVEKLPVLSSPRDGFAELAGWYS